MKRKPGRPYSGGPTPTRSLRMGPIYDRAQEIAKLQGTTITAVIEDALAAFITEHEGRTQ